MPNEIVAYPEMPIYVFMIAVWLFTASLLVLAFVLLARGSQMLDAVVAWTRRTFTRAGDGCADCSRVSATVHCKHCGVTRALRPAEVLHRTVPASMSRDPRPAAVGDQRRRQQLEALAMMQPTSGVN